MEVIKKGHPPKDWSMEVECGGIMGGCGAVLLVSETDLYEVYDTVCDQKVGIPVFTCPECGTQNYIARKLPLNIRCRGKEPPQK